MMVNIVVISTMNYATIVKSTVSTTIGCDVWYDKVILNRSKSSNLW